MNGYKTIRSSFFESFRAASLSSSNPIAQVMRDPQIDAWLEKVNLK